MADGYLRELLARDEAVLIETRQHWFAAVRYALKPILLIGLIILLAIGNQVFDFDGVLNILNEIVQIVLIIGVIVAVVWLPIDLVQWYSRRYVLTGRRVIRLEGILSKKSMDSSLEKINDIETFQGVFGRAFNYANLVFYTASDQANEQYDQLTDGLQFKKAVLDAKEAIRVGAVLQSLPEGFIVAGGTNAASRGGSAAAADAAAAPDPEEDRPTS